MSLQPLGREVDCVENFLVAGAATEIAAERLAHRRLAGISFPFKEVRDRHDKTRRTEPALNSAGFEERLLDHVQPLSVVEGLDGTDVAIVRLRSQYQAAADEGPIQPYRT